MSATAADWLAAQFDEPSRQRGRHGAEQQVDQRVVKLGQQGSRAATFEIAFGSPMSSLRAALAEVRPTAGVGAHLADDRVDLESEGRRQHCSALRRP